MCPHPKEKGCLLNARDRARLDNRLDEQLDLLSDVDRLALLDALHEITGTPKLPDSQWDQREQTWCDLDAASVPFD
jgi:hypothetical protein